MVGTTVNFYCAFSHPPLQPLPFRLLLCVSGKQPVSPNGIRSTALGYMPTSLNDCGLEGPFLHVSVGPPFVRVVWNTHLNLGPKVPVDALIIF